MVAKYIIIVLFSTLDNSPSLYTKAMLLFPYRDEHLSHSVDICQLRDWNLLLPIKITLTSASEDRCQSDSKQNAKDKSKTCNCCTPEIRQRIHTCGKCLEALSKH